MIKEGWAKYSEWLNKYNIDAFIIPQKDETWHIILPLGSTVISAKVKDITDKTVQLEYDFGRKTARYLFRDIKFVEKVQ